jgi:glutathione S-transferase
VDAHANELKEEVMKLYVLPPSPRALKVMALKNHLSLECEMQIVDLGKDLDAIRSRPAWQETPKLPGL